MEEITATSFYVDVASKLQHAAGRNQVMLGDSLKSFIDFPEDLLTVKTGIQNNKQVDRPILLPNITDASGTPINYKQHLLAWEKYLELSPLAQTGFLPSGTGALPSVQVSAGLYREKYAGYEGPYYPSSTLGPKDKAICFTISKLPYTPLASLQVKCIVENHGQEARAAGETCDNHQDVYEIKPADQHKDLYHWEHLQYRGLHYLIVEVRNGHGVVARTKFGVYVE